MASFEVDLKRGALITVKALKNNVSLAADRHRGLNQQVTNAFSQDLTLS
jgi:hypothetical protein